MPPRTEVLREVWRITEMKSGAILKTAYVEDRWIPLEEAALGAKTPEGYLLVCKSMSFEGQTLRSVRS